MDKEHWLPHQLLDDSEDSDDSVPVPQRPGVSPLNQSEGVISSRSIRPNRSLTPCPRAQISPLYSTIKGVATVHHPPSPSFWQYQMKSERTLPTAKMTQKIEALRKIQTHFLDLEKSKHLTPTHRSGSRHMISHRTDTSEFKRIHRMMVKGTSALPGVRNGKGNAMSWIHKKPISPMTMMVVISPRVRPERTLGVNRLVHVNRYS